ncbi:MAG: hypothetical protein LAP40_04850 [Acidobacteriia bacterium]|nr:hypothetical protein [Terriglobia bacterium]
MRITRYPSLSEFQFLGCTAAFVDSLTGELNAAALALRRLEGQAKGSAFAYEMTLDTHRYGALIVLDRFATFVRAFGPHVHLSRRREMVDSAPARVATAEDILGRANQLIDAAPAYASDLVEACVLAFQSLDTTFAAEREAAAQNATLGPMLPEEYSEARRIFLEDLAAR